MANELLELLARAALAGSGAIVVALMLRRPLRRFAGADAAYLCWLLVPVAMLAACLPALRVAPVVVQAMAPALKVSTLVAQAVTPDATGWLDLARLVWLAGMLATAAILAAGQRRFVRSLGALTEQDGVFVAAHARHGPALLGLWRPVIVVPSDFNSRYTVQERALIIAHEQLHAERRDPLANAVLALLQCAFWFNPLMHIAASRFRFDQELACDAGVLARADGQRQAYAAAMLKTQSAGAPALATCHWQSSHPLKERIMHLKQNPSKTGRLAGRTIVALLACVSIMATVAARADSAPASGKDYDIAVNFGADAGDATPTIQVKAGEAINLEWKKPGFGWKGEFVVLPAENDKVQVKMKIIQENGQTLAPTLMMRLGEPGAVASETPGGPTFKVGMTVTRPAAKAPGA